MELKDELFFIKRASQTEGNGLNLDELQCSMMHKVNHGCILLSGFISRTPCSFT